MYVRLLSVEFVRFKDCFARSISSMKRATSDSVIDLSSWISVDGRVGFIIRLKQYLQI